MKTVEEKVHAMFSDRSKQNTLIAGSSDIDEEDTSLHGEINDVIREQDDREL